MLGEKIITILNRNAHYLVKKINLLNINGIVLKFAEDILEAVIKPNPTSDISWFLSDHSIRVKRNGLWTFGVGVGEWNNGHLLARLPPLPLLDFTQQIIYLPQLGEKKLNFAQSIQN